MFGPLWRTSLEYPKLDHSSSCVGYPGWAHLGCVPDWVKVRMPDGEVYSYKIYNLPIYYPDGVTNGTSTYGYIMASSSEWQVFIGNRIYTYNWSTKRLMSIKENGALLYSFVYAADKLQSVTNRAGQQVRFNWSAWSGHRVSAITAPDGSVWNYQYDGSGNLVSAGPSGAASGIKNYHYEDSRNSQLLTGYSVDGFRQTRYTYDASGRATRSATEDGEEAENFTYGALTTSVTDARGQQINYNFANVAGAKVLTSTDRVATTSCGFSQSSNTYDARGNIKSSIDWSGMRTETTANTLGQITQQVTGAGSTHPLTINNAWGGYYLASSEYTNSIGQAFKRDNFTYGSGLAGGYLTSRKTTDLRTGAERVLSIAYSFHPNGMLATQTESEASPVGDRVRTKSWDANGFLVSEVNEAGHQVVYQGHNGLGLPGRRIDAAGVIEDYVYDSYGRENARTRNWSGGSLTTWTTYDGLGRPTQIASSDGRVRRYGFTVAGRPYLLGDGLAQYETISLDSATNTLIRRMPRVKPAWNGSTVTLAAEGDATTYTQLDSLGRVWKRSGSSGLWEQFSYDGMGRPRGRTDSLGRTTTYSYDGRERLSELNTGGSGSIRYGYDPDGNLASVTDDGGRVTSYTYNSFGDLLSVNSPDSGGTSYDYFSNGWLKSEARANGVVIWYAWDKLGRPTSRSSAGVTESFSYDQGSYGIGRLTGISDATGSTSYSYHGTGALLTQTTSVVGQAYSLG
jgi:YD repeat-containing protein